MSERCRHCELICTRDKLIHITSLRFAAYRNRCRQPSCRIYYTSAREVFRYCCRIQVDAPILVTTYQLCSKPRLDVYVVSAPRFSIEFRAAGFAAQHLPTAEPEAPAAADFRVSASAISHEATSTSTPEHDAIITTPASFDVRWSKLLSRHSIRVMPMPRLFD